MKNSSRIHFVLFTCEKFHAHENFSDKKWKQALLNLMLHSLEFIYENVFEFQDKLSVHYITIVMRRGWIWCMILMIIDIVRCEHVMSRLPPTHQKPSYFWLYRFHRTYRVICSTCTNSRKTSDSKHRNFSCAFGEKRKAEAIFIINFDVSS